MEKEQILEALKKAKDSSKKRKFTQSIDLIINLKGVDVKKADQQINLFTPLHYSKGKETKVCALVGPELLSQAKEICDFAVSADDLSKYTIKKDIKKLADSYDFFIAQATIMPKIATAFGKVFGPRGKMPNPKAGCVVPPKFNLKPLYEKLQNTIRIYAKEKPLIQLPIGEESMNDDLFAVLEKEILNKIIEAINQKEELDKYIIIGRERSEIKKENFDVIIHCAFNQSKPGTSEEAKKIFEENIKFIILTLILS